MTLHLIVCACLGVCASERVRFPSDHAPASVSCRTRSRKTRRFPEPNILPRTWNDGHETPSPPPPPPPAPSHFPAQARGPEHDGGALMSVSRHSSPRQVMADRQAARAHAGREGGGAGRGGGGGGAWRQVDRDPPPPSKRDRRRIRILGSDPPASEHVRWNASKHPRAPLCMPRRPRQAAHAPRRQVTPPPSRLSGKTPASPPSTRSCRMQGEPDRRPGLMTGIASWRVRTEAHRVDPFGEREVCTPSPFEIKAREEGRHVLLFLYKGAWTEASHNPFEQT